MGFEKLLDYDMPQTDFGKSRYIKNTKEHQNLSKVRLDTDPSVKYIKIGEWVNMPFDQGLGTRYIVCQDLTYDMMLVISDANTRYTIVYRFFRPDAQVLAQIAAIVKVTLRGANLEARLIGLQNGQEYGGIREIYDFVTKSGLPLAEVDLFGNEVRHIALDAATGVPYDILMLNRPYKPGELNNAKTLEQFERDNNIPVVQRVEPVTIGKIREEKAMEKSREHAKDKPMGHGGLFRRRPQPDQKGQTTVHNGQQQDQPHPAAQPAQQKPPA